MSATFINSAYNLPACPDFLVTRVSSCHLHPDRLVCTHSRIVAGVGETLSIYRVVIGWRVYGLGGWRVGGYRVTGGDTDIVTANPTNNTIIGVAKAMIVFSGIFFIRNLVHAFEMFPLTRQPSRTVSRIVSSHRSSHVTPSRVIQLVCLDSLVLHTHRNKTTDRSQPHKSPSKSWAQTLGL